MNHEHDRWESMGDLDAGGSCISYTILYTASVIHCMGCPAWATAWALMSGSHARHGENHDS